MNFTCLKEKSGEFWGNAAIKKKNIWVLPLYTILYLQEQNCI